jgi:hypothetical protein
LDQKRLDEFLKQHCVRVYKSGRDAPTIHDNLDEPRWAGRTNSARENLMIRDGRLQPTQPFLGVKPVGRPPGRPPGSPNVKGRKLSWELPKST